MYILQPYMGPAESESPGKSQGLCNFNTTVHDSHAHRSLRTSDREHH